MATTITVPPGNMNVSQAVISVPFGADGLTPVSPTNPPLLPQGDDANQKELIDLLRQIDAKLGAMLLLQGNAFGVKDDPLSLIDAAQSSMRSSVS